MPASATWSAKPHSHAAADRLRSELRVSPAVAAILVRRGLETPALARAFLRGDERHEARLLDGAVQAAALIREHAARGSRIVVHGDYDVDGICSTAVLVRALRALGAEPGWHLPSRSEDGYGLSLPTVERLAAAGTGLLVTVDCGISSLAEVAHARALGMDVVVSDHHRPGNQLPDCPVVHPALGGYPFPDLCAAGVAYKLAEVLLGEAPEQDLDLVALATVCDVVPLVGENRRLVRQGLELLSRTRRVGLRALMRTAAVEPGSVSAGSLGFRLGPRLNAAGRLARADAGLELLLTEDGERAEQIAAELESLNRERQDTEMRILWSAEEAARAQMHSAALVLAGEGWHPGVIGIVASRMVERHSRPCVMVAMEGDRGRGSGRSIPAWDLHAGLAACSEHLVRFGGHRVAAGLELEAASLDAFRAAFQQRAGSELAPEDLRRVERIDAVVPGGSLGLPLAEELATLGPFGAGNPEPTLLVPAARISDVRGMGDERQHSRFTISSGGRRARAVAFRTTPGELNSMGEDACSLSVRLEASEWGGSVEPRLVLRAACPPGEGSCELLPEPGLWDAVAAELERDPGGWCDPGPALRELRDRREEGIAGVAGELIASGESVLVVCADVPRRRAALDRVLGGLVPGRAPWLCSWHALATGLPGAERFEHLLLLDPPESPAGVDLALAVPGGFVHIGWGAAECDFAEHVTTAALDLRAPLAQVYRELRAAGGSAAGPELEELLCGAGAHPRARDACGRLVRVLTELGLAEWHAAGRSLHIASAERTELERSPAFVAYTRRAAAARAYLRSGAGSAQPASMAAAAA